jgi:ribosomal protein L32
MRPLIFKPLYRQMIGAAPPPSLPPPFSPSPLPSPPPLPLPPPPALTAHSSRYQRGVYVHIMYTIPSTTLAMLFFIRDRGADTTETQPHPQCMYISRGVMTTTVKQSLSPRKHERASTAVIRTVQPHSRCKHCGGYHNKHTITSTM